MKRQISHLVKHKSVRQLMKYGLVGMVGLVIDMGVYYLLINKFSVHYPFSETISYILGGKMSIGMLDILISNIISQTLAIINNFILNSYFTFKVTDNKLKRFVSFGSIAIGGMVISSKLFAVFIVAAIQFSINKFVTFRQA